MHGAWPASLSGLFAFSGGEAGHTIIDGGSDMFDEGNELRIHAGTQAPHPPHPQPLTPPRATGSPARRPPPSHAAATSPQWIGAYASAADGFLWENGPAGAEALRAAQMVTPLEYTQDCDGAHPAALPGPSAVSYSTCKTAVDALGRPAALFAAAFHSAEPALNGLAVSGGTGADGAGGVTAGATPLRGATRGTFGYFKSVYNEQHAAYGHETGVSPKAAPRPCRPSHFSVSLPRAPARR